jgi:hypothetical protein
MKRSLFSALAALGATAAIAAPGYAQVVLPGVTDAMDALKNGASSTTITTTTGGVESTAITNTQASGGKVGTFTASGSEGESQRFSVGTATNFGINASGSSTAEYAVDSRATLGLGGSAYSQTIGTSGSNLDARSSGSLAESYAANEVETKIGSSAQNSYEREVANGSNRSGYAWWSPTTTWNSLTQEQKSAYESSYSSEASSIRTSATSTFNNNETVREAANGVISGSFVEKSQLDTESNNVEVRGIGNSANMRNGSNSVFDVKVSARPTVGLPTSNSATANGSAGGSMSSTASADASKTSFSSMFIQSF